MWHKCPLLLYMLKDAICLCEHVFRSQIQDSRPTLISSIEGCVYTFLWLTAAACPLNSTQHDDCRVTNPATGQTLKENHQFCIVLSYVGFYHLTVW